MYVGYTNTWERKHEDCITFWKWLFEGENEKCVQKAKMTQLSKKENNDLMVITTQMMWLTIFTLEITL